MLLMPSLITLDHITLATLVSLNFQNQTSAFNMSSVPRSSSASQLEHHVLLQERHIKLRTTYEKDLMSKDREFEHTSTFDPYFLQKIGMDAEFDLIFHNIGWDNNRSISEDGCKLLTLEFLCTLSFTKTYVSFRLFNEQYEFT
jgi:hypothetical protein